jgi:hypothetical protein
VQLRLPIGGLEMRGRGDVPRMAVGRDSSAVKLVIIAHGSPFLISQQFPQGLAARKASLP